MKKVLSMLLCLVLVLSLSACGDGYKTDKNAKAEDIFAAAMQNLNTTVKNLLDQDAEATQLSFTLKGNAAAALALPMQTENKEITLSGKMEGSGLADNKKGASILLNAETDAMKALSAMFGTAADDSAEDLKLEVGAYLDLAAKRGYVKDAEGSWEYQDVDPADLKKVDTSELDKLTALTLDKVFETHTFTVEKDQYVFEGTALVSAVDTDALPDGASDFLDLAKELKPTLKMTVNADKKITGLQFSIKDFSLDLTAMLGMSATIKELTMELGVKYETVNFSVPDAVKTEAESNH